MGAGKIHPRDFRPAPGEPVHLGRWPTQVKRLYKGDKDYRHLLERDVKELSSLQQVLYASGTYALLLIFQALDAAGKDGAISHVMSGVNPQGCDVHSFKEPSAEERAHDFLWRTTVRLPGRGRIGIFNRSYYEEVLVVRVHPKLLQGAGLPAEELASPHLWPGRYRSIVEFERHLHRNGTRVVKFFLHLSKAEQRRRFLARIDEPDKNWKFSLDDIKERGFWDDYTRAYEKCLAETASKGSPWYIIPADDKLNARLIVSRIVIQTLKGLGLDFPVVTRARKQELRAIGRQLARKDR
jgi:PPK2 family polyphosphate:nucleotide phosphotransferase